MKYLFYFFLSLLFISCKEDSSKAPKRTDASFNHKDTVSINQGTGSVKLSNVGKEAELLSDSVSLYRYGLQDTLREDVNCDGFIDQIFFSKQNSLRHIILLDGKSKTQKVLGLDLRVQGELDADYSWADFWGITRDTSTWEMIIDDGEIAGSRTVTLQCPSIVLRKEEVGGGIITFKNAEFIWVHQAD